MAEYRIGQGYDVHQLVEGRPLIIGGVTIPHPKGLIGHSDADVLLHAIMDALLGAAGLPDIGHQFPNNDSRFKNADSGLLLARVFQLLKDAGVTRIVNIDCTILAENPKMAPHIELMKSNISHALAIPSGQVNIKATTTETLGFVGREEGIAAMAVCLVERNG
ncbi:MAG: 2-C-methyl-D-erythritol 2,4-cyclodiphosphate synthase [Candidatus Zixiibacteriota bacterium]